MDKLRKEVAKEYDRFKKIIKNKIELINEISPFVGDANQYVGDELKMIDEYLDDIAAVLLISPNGKTTFKRVQLPIKRHWLKWFVVVYRIDVRDQSIYELLQRIEQSISKNNGSGLVNGDINRMVYGRRRMAVNMLITLCEYIAANEHFKEDLRECAYELWLMGGDYGIGLFYDYNTLYEFWERLNLFYNEFADLFLTNNDIRDNYNEIIKRQHNNL